MGPSTQRARACRQMNTVAGLLTSIEQNCLLVRARASTSRVEGMYERTSANSSRGSLPKWQFRALISEADVIVCCSGSCILALLVGVAMLLR